MNLFIVILITLGVLHTADCYEGVLFVRQASDRSWTDKPHFCIYYNPMFHNLTSVKSEAKTYNLTDMSTKYGCYLTDYLDEKVSGKAVLVARGNCTFSRKARIAQASGAKAVIVSSVDLITPAAANATIDYKDINITVATIFQTSVSKMGLSNNKTMEVLMYAPDLKGKFDGSMILIFFISVLNIAVGGYWAGHVKHAKYQRLKQTAKSMENLDADGETENEGSTDSDKDKEDESVDVTVPTLLIFIVFMCAFLVLLYFFYDQMVYVIISIFCIASSSSMYYCLRPLWKKLVCFTARIPQNKIPFFRKRPEYRNIALALVCMGFAVFWAIQRHASYAWMLQDILGCSFCIYMMKTVGVPNLKVCTVLLVLLFVYDVFFVFITPLITKKGDSVMVKVATGEGSKTHETIPMVFKVPKLTPGDINVCPLPYSLLGFGDIIIPGFLVAHNHAFDLFIGSKKVYYLCTVIAYAIGVILTYVGLTLMQTGQPALLYLVPCTLVTTFLIGLVRGEVKYLWAGMNQSNTEENRSGNEEGQGIQSNETINSSSSGSSANNERGELLG